MRTIGLVVVTAVLFACQRQVEVRGLYVNDGRTGYLFACDQPGSLTPLQVPDSALAAAYRLKAPGTGQPLFARVRGVRADSGSIYDSRRYFLVHEVLEVRAPHSGECRFTGAPLNPGAGSGSAAPGKG